MPLLLLHPVFDETKAATGIAIHVTTVGGVVTLRGTVASSEISDCAEKLTHDTSGVKSVRNHLHVAHRAG